MENARNETPRGKVWGGVSLPTRRGVWRWGDAPTQNF